MTQTDKWQLGGAYERYMGRWSRLLAPRFLEWIGAPAGQRWLDVGCGTGALCAAIVEQAAPLGVVGVDPSAGFLEAARANLPPTVVLHAGPADAIPLGDAEADVTVASLVLNFVPDVGAALRDMQRVTSPGGTVAACVWDYAGRMDLIRNYWDTTAALGLPGHDQGERFPVCRPGALKAAFEAAGLQDVQDGAIELPMHFDSFDDYWSPFLGGTGPAPAHAMALDEATRGRVREALRARLPANADGSLDLVARAWVAKGRMRG